VAKDGRREPWSEFAWSLGISWCDNLQVKPEIAFQIWSQWVKKLTKFAPIGRGRGKPRKPMICVCGRFGLTTISDVEARPWQSHLGNSSSKCDPSKSCPSPRLGHSTKKRLAWRTSLGLRGTCV
jgi:hypothetical protein